MMTLRCSLPWTGWHQVLGTCALIWGAALIGCGNPTPAIEPPPGVELATGSPWDGQERFGELFPPSVPALERIDSLLFIGNSHSSPPLPQLVKQMIESDMPGTEVEIEVAMAPHLSAHVDSPGTQQKFSRRRWSAVVLQSQPYSTSGRFQYSTEPSHIWIARVKDTGAMPVLYPEWSQLHLADEAVRVHRLHRSISEQSPARVAPVGLAWDAARREFPSVRFHASDGNHAELTGLFLTAAVLYGTITGKSPEDLPALDIEVDAETQAALRRIAWKTIESQRNPKEPSP